MGDRQSNLPFDEGATFYGSTTAVAADVHNIVGKEYLIEVPPSVYPGQQYRKLRAIKNTSGISLLPKRAVRYSVTAGEFGRFVDGYTALDQGFVAGIVDPLLPSTGLANNDVGYIAIEGPALTLMPLSQVGDIAVGDNLVALTGATSQATTSGRVQKQTLTGATAPLADNIQNCIGKALSAVSSSSTNNDVLVDLAIKW